MPFKSITNSTALCDKIENFLSLAKFIVPSITLDIMFHVNLLLLQENPIFENKSIITNNLSDLKKIWIMPC
ncbi:Uncharacterised protein [Legionella wadsworthii]|uniref:Uncharacterized protein n=1 Tax=Legionella wadsworthii TaxID=28088 RepID=A0A378LRY3_9GAMM|nr:Uncharacterised protein [Legionella wadsworthii]